MPRIRASPSLGIPTDESTIISITTLPLGIPGVPIDEIVVTAIMVRICAKLRSIFITWAIKIAATA